MLQLIVSHTHDVCAHDTHKSTCLTRRKQKGSEFMDCFSFTGHTHVSLLSICMHGTYTKSSNSYIWCLLLLRACHNALPSVWTRVGSFERILQTTQTYILEEMDRRGLWDSFSVIFMHNHEAKFPSFLSVSSSWHLSIYLRAQIDQESASAK